ncbi:MarR family winged helix-turn-helix transcriptional regulator [Rarobacter incanus]|uniref:MarR family transcriptional regulator n=1 Tax=Rarobacter incanus TaxID=153494 RepID=A0A542SP99_9MICO|nr:MarR family winged helix-turn-helix transcriptional regulator [Rarobacter incanus]TQK76446.1 MarR family transcriptional regulator [Rarobacter incanus]
MDNLVSPPPNPDAARLMAAASSFIRTAARTTDHHLPTLAMSAMAHLERLGKARIGELARLERITQPAITVAIRKLEAAELVVRSSDPWDARACVLSLTPAGVAELAAFRARADETMSAALEGLAEADRQRLTDAAELLELLTDRFPAAYWEHSRR